MSIVTTTRLLITPDNSEGNDTLACTGASSPNLGSYGAWVEFIASTSNTTTIAGIYLRTITGSNMWFVFEYGVGAAGAEVSVAEQYIHMPTSGNHYKFIHLLELPIGGIPAGSRIAIRMRSQATVTSGSDQHVTLLYYEDFDSDHVLLAGEFQTYEPEGFIGLSLTPAGTAFSPSAWVELVSAFAFDGAIIGISVSNHTSHVEHIWELGTGAAGSETVITTLRTSTGAGNGGGFANIDLPAPYPIPEGTRVALRFKKTGTDTTVHRVGLRYIGDIDVNPPSPFQRVTQQALLVWYNAAAEAPPPAFDACAGGGTVPTGTNPAAGEDLSAARAPIPWVAITVGATTYRYAGATVPHSPPRYGRVVSFGSVSRFLSEPDSGPRAATVTIDLVDVDRVLRTLGNAGTLKHALLEMYVSNLPTIVAEGTPFRVFRGRIAEWSDEPGLRFSITAEDELTARLTSIDAEDLTLGISLLDAVSDGNPEEQTFGKPAPEGYGHVTDEDEDNPKGVWELVYSASITFPEAPALGNRHVFPICVGAIDQVQSVFGPSPFEDPPVTRVKLPASVFGDWLHVVTMPGWFGANQYYVDGSLGHRWSLLVGLQGHPSVEMAREGRIPFTINFCGYETKGESTQNTIDSFPRGFLHWMNNRLVQDMAAGDQDWATSQFDFGGYSLFHTQSFEDVHDLFEGSPGLPRRLGGVLGHDLEFQSWRDRWADWLKHHGYGSATGYNRHGQVILTYLDRTNIYDATPIIGPDKILERGCRVRRRDDAVENVVRYVAQRNYRSKIQAMNPPEGERGLRDPYDGPWLYLATPLEDSTSITALGGDPRGRRQSAIQEYGLTRDIATADSLAAERLAWTKVPNGRPEIDFDLSLRHAWDLELGDVINLEHWDLPWTNTQRCQIRGIEWNLDSHVVTVTVWHVGDLLP